MSDGLAAFDKSQRLLKPADFDFVFSLRQSVHNESLGVYVAYNKLGKPRLGLVVSKKVSKKAVVRNRIKRLIRESFRAQREMLGPRDFVVIAKPPLAQIAFTPIIPSLQNVWIKAIKRCKK